MTGLLASLRLTSPVLRLLKHLLTKQLSLFKRLLSLLLNRLRSSLLLKKLTLLPKSKTKQKSPHKRKVRDKKMLKYPDKEEAAKNGAVVKTADVEATAITTTVERVAVDAAAKDAVEEATAEVEPTTVDTTAVPSKMTMVS